MKTSPPLDIWHEGEIILQRSTGMADRLREAGPRVIRDFLPDQHRHFFETLSFAVVGTLDEAARPWAGLFAGDRGFVTTPDDRTIRIGRDRAPIDPVEHGISTGSPIAILGIEPSTRRRNRANGMITSATEHDLLVHVEHSFGNCPQYITRRTLVSQTIVPKPPHRRATRLDEDARAFIARADTFFVASSTTRYGGHVQADVSHRGGPPGFVSVDDDGVIHIPDFAGNNYFNTLGNILSTGRAGLVFPDFHNGDVLQITGEAAVFGVDRAAHPDFPCDRFWTVRPTEIVWRPASLGIIEPQ